MSDQLEYALVRITASGDLNVIGLPRRTREDAEETLQLWSDPRDLAKLRIVYRTGLGQPWMYVDTLPD